MERDAARESSGALVMPADEAVGVSIDNTKSNTEVSESPLRLGTEAFADECRRLDGRPLGYRFIKRAFDIAFSTVIIAVGFIPCAILSIAIAVDTKGSPIYTQKRVGRLGRFFCIYKFRTMVADADDVEKYLDAKQLAQWKRERKVDNDPRITRLGSVLRKTSLDELPQFINVLKGQMSIIGPRVISYDELSNYSRTDIPVLLSVPQGITGPWQAGPRNEANFENGQRQAIELAYARHPTVGEDLKVFFSTIETMFVERTGR